MRFSSSSESFSNAISNCDSDLQKIEAISESDNFCDNRDFSVFHVSDPLTKERMEFNQQRYLEDEKVWIKFRCLLMKTITAAYNCIVQENVKDGEVGDQEIINNSDSDRDQIFDAYDKLLKYYETFKDKLLHFEIVSFTVKKFKTKLTIFLATLTRNSAISIELLS